MSRKEKMTDALREKAVAHAEKALSGEVHGKAWGSMYKTIHELTAEQFEELRENLERELAAEPDGVPDGMVDSDGRILDECVVAQYENTMFTDDDFSCTAK